MKIEYRMLIILFFCVVVSGCASTMIVSVNPAPHVIKSEIGHGNDLVIKVNDLRTSKVLGQWHGNVFYDAADIITREEVSDIFKKAIENGMASKGFKIIPFNEEHPRRLIVDIITYEYSQQLGMWLEGINGKGCIKVKAFKNGRVFEQAYSSNVSDNLGLIRQDYVENMLNAMTVDLLQKTLNDQELINFLIR